MQGTLSVDSYARALVATALIDLWGLNHEMGSNSENSGREVRPQPSSA